MSLPRLPRLLIVDDEPNVHYSFQRAFEDEFEICSAYDGDEALQRLESEAVDAVLLDLEMPRMNGMEVLSRLRQTHADLPVVVMTAYASTEVVIRATALAARDFVSKPIDVPKLRDLLQSCLPARGSRTPGPIPEGVGGLLGHSPAMLELYKHIGRAAAVDSTVLVTGESGTGKELIARAIHEHGPNATGPFIAINCAAIPAALLESELFGHEKGAFTGATQRRSGKFELAAGGTLLLDEIGDMAPALQTKLLRVLQSREVTPLGASVPLPCSARVIASTNADIEADVRAGTFREDLYYRLNVYRIDVPPLRTRADDVDRLADAFLAREQKSVGRSLHGFTPEARSRLRAHDWPGNVRELENAIAQAALRARGDLVAPGDLILGRPSEAAGTEPAADTDTLERSLRALAAARPGQLFDHVEKTLFQTALALCDQNQVQAAKLLGVSRNVLRHRMAKHDL